MRTKIRAALVLGLALATLPWTGGGCGDADLMHANDFPRVRLTLRSSGSPVVGDTVMYDAEVIDSPYLASSYYWSVTDSQSQPLKVSSLDSAGRSVSFTASSAGTHRIYCEATLEGSGARVTASVTLQVQDSQYQQLTHTALVIPPPSSSLPRKEFSVTVGGVSDSTLAFALDQGQEVELQVSGSSGPAAAMVRLLQIGSDSTPQDIYLASGAGKVRVSGQFHALVVPDAADLASRVLYNQNAAKLGSTWPIALDGGKLVQGKVLRKDATPLTGATVSIQTTETHSGVQVPSTVGLTKADGTFSVRTDTGPASITIVPPQASGLPVALVQGQALMVLADATDWVFTFAEAQPATVTGKVTLSDGSTPAAGAQVVMTASSSQAAGDLTVSAGAPIKATSVFRHVLTTDSAGALRDPLAPGASVIVPQGTYTVELWPGASAPADQGYTTSTVTLAPATPLALALVERVSLTGAVKASGGSAVRARITATSAAGQFVTTSDSAGAFKLDLDDQSTYSLEVRPLQSDQVLSRHVAPKVAIAGDKALGTVELSKAIELGGRVTSAGGSGIAGALIRIWCSSQDCPASSVLDEVQSRSDGSFSLRVPPSPLKSSP